MPLLPKFGRFNESTPTVSDLLTPSETTGIRSEAATPEETGKFDIFESIIIIIQR